MQEKIILKFDFPGNSPLNRPHLGLNSQIHFSNPRVWLLLLKNEVLHQITTKFSHKIFNILLNTAKSTSQSLFFTMIIHYITINFQILIRIYHVTKLL